MKIKTESGTVELYQKIERYASGWSEVIRPDLTRPGESKVGERLWLNTYIEWYDPLDRIDVTVTVGDS